MRREWSTRSAWAKLGIRAEVGRVCGVLAHSHNGFAELGPPGTCAKGSAVVVSYPAKRDWKWHCSVVHGTKFQRGFEVRAALTEGWCWGQRRRKGGKRLGLCGDTVVIGKWRCEGTAGGWTGPFRQDRRERTDGRVWAWWTGAVVYGHLDLELALTGLGLRVDCRLGVDVVC